MALISIFSSAFLPLSLFSAFSSIIDISPGVSREIWIPFSSAFENSFFVDSIISSPDFTSTLTGAWIFSAREIVSRAFSILFLALFSREHTFDLEVSSFSAISV